MTLIVDLFKDHSIPQGLAMRICQLSELKLLGVGALLCAAAIVTSSATAGTAAWAAMTVAATATPAAPPQAAAPRDGQRDFDFDIGTWKTHLRRLVHPLSGSTTWVELDGTTVVRKIWDGRANLAELET